MNKRQIKVQALISADLPKVWACYTDPRHITKWNFASDDWQCPKAANDLRAGGKFSARMEAKDGSAGFDFEGIYDEVIHEKKISYTMGDGRAVTVIFDGSNGKTEVEVTFDAENQNSDELQKGGWQAILDNFKKYTEGN